MFQSIANSSWSIALTLIAIIGVTWGLYKTAEGIRDIYYQTFPVVTVGAASKAPFGLPFSVSNPSGWFPMRDVKWDAVIDDMVLAGNNRMSNVTASFAAANEIRPLETKHYTFPVAGVTSDMVKSLSVDIVIHYSTLGWQREPLKTRFTWRSNSWIKGQIVQ